MVKICNECHSKNKKSARFCNDCGTRFLGESPDRHLQDCGNIFEVMKLNDVRTVKKLIRGGCPVNVTDDDGYTPLHWAAEYGYLVLVQTLLKKGADRNARTRDGWLALDLSKAEGHREVEEYLRDYASDNKKAPVSRHPNPVKRK